jgi:hypothetical protein
MRLLVSKIYNSLLNYCTLYICGEKTKSRTLFITRKTASLTLNLKMEMVKTTIRDQSKYSHRKYKSDIGTEYTKRSHQVFRSKHPLSIGLDRIDGFIRIVRAKYDITISMKHLAHWTVVIWGRRYRYDNHTICWMLVKFYYHVQV